MAELALVRYLNNRQPPITSQILDENGDPVNLTSTTVKFQMRAVGTSTLKVDALATIVDASTGQVRYDLAALDVDTAGYYVGWWRITLASGQYTETPEDLIWVQAHAPVSNQYVSVAEFKETLTMGGETFADADIARALEAASNVVDEMTGSGPFTLASATQRKFTPVATTYLKVGAVAAITAFASEGTAWVQNTDYYVDGSYIKILNGKRFNPCADPQSVVITADWGYSSVPPEIKEATQIIATQLLRRSREAPFGILATSLDGPAIRLGRFDPQVEALLERYRTGPVVG